MRERGYVLQHRPLAKLDLWIYVPGLRWKTSQDAAYAINSVMYSWLYSDKLPFLYAGSTDDPFLHQLLYHWHHRPDSYRIIALASMLRTQLHLRA